ncbi:pericentriolar material 1 protein-like isoform X2 [Gigantopelta aegis]|uniref:pericentriolar material 1 protein-like isoform X2 n=1 Tax=Gigantopelta aegis TaxID=1735272 RepID=UPI001B88E018|nr:pericentriolar material 1 protein-like isoform X2 [Gigantopelta aegis]
MATGGVSMSKKEVKQRSNWQRTTSFSDRDDVLSLSSVPNEVRINNWDFSDWKPTTQSLDGKRKKKSKGNPEREREQSLSLDSPPQTEKKQHTPSTYPRTRITATTPTSQRVALENLRQHMTFSDFDDQLGAEGEPNNERVVNTDRLRRPNYKHPGPSGSMDDLRPNREVRANHNNNRAETPGSYGPDSNQIVGRLMQIRDYIKQATGMMDNLQKFGDQSDDERAAKLKQVITSLKQQELNCLENLQKLWAMRDEALMRMPNGTGSAPVQDDDKHDSDDTISVDLEIHTNASETTEENTLSSSSRPRIEDKLGDTDGEESDSNSSEASGNMDNTVIPGHLKRHTHWDIDRDVEETAVVEVSNEREQIEQLKHQEELLKILLEKQAQLKALQERQDALLTMKDSCEKRLAVASTKQKEAAGITAQITAAVEEAGAQAAALRQDIPPLKSNIVGYPESEDDERNSEHVPKELADLRRDLNILRNELKTETSNLNNTEVETATLISNRQQLQDKMRDLQEKKQQMDILLGQLQTLRTRGLDQMDYANTDDDNMSPTSSQIKITDSLGASAAAGDTAETAQEMLDMMDAQNKLSQLHDVRDRLNKLRDLVQYYQTTKGENSEMGEQDEQSSVPGYSDYGEGELTRMSNRQQGNSDRAKLHQVPVQETFTFPGMQTANISAPEQSDEENASGGDSDEASVVSSLGPWGDDPEIQEKVRKLKAAKEKLRRLQDLVTIVQQSPDAALDLPENLSANLDDDVVAQLTRPSDQNVTSEGEITDQAKPSVPRSDVPLHIQRGELESLRTQTQGLLREVASVQTSESPSLEAQREELEKLKVERHRLLAIQSALQHFQATEDAMSEESVTPRAADNQSDKIQEDQQPQGHQNTPVVTFASNDELYSKMRKQRILREELRQKKKELEAIMKKDRNKKSYVRNQDNQSDTVSYSTDAFAPSASVDVTMATWGGSTVDNLGSITEDEDGNDRNEDDGYPSDGIVQVEEEEEEQDSENGTYTIEEDARKRRSERAMRSMERPKTARGRTQGYPQPIRKQIDSTRPKQIARPQKKKGKGKKVSKTKQENYRSPEEIVNEAEQSPKGQTLAVLQQQLERMSHMCQALLLDQQNISQANSSLSSSGMLLSPTAMARGNLVPDMLQQQIQQQQMMMCQCYQQLSMQQMEIHNLYQNLNRLSQHNLSEIAEDHRPSPLVVPHMVPPSASAIPNSAATSSFNLPPSQETAFTLEPQSPLFRDLPHERRAPSASSTKWEDMLKQSSQANGAASGFHVNNLRPAPPPRLDSYLRCTGMPESSYQANQSANNHVNILTLSGPQKEKAAGDNAFNTQNTRKRKSQQEQSMKSQSATGKKYSTPTTESSAGNQRYQPGLSSGISGAGFQDMPPVSSAREKSTSGFQDMPSLPTARAATSPNSLFTRAREYRSAGELSLFEALKETIYSEVAVFISQNESRPHFLIELFRILQQLNTDYLRQRGLYAVQDLVSKTLSKEGNNNNCVPSVRSPWMGNAGENWTASELTPSESIATSDEEEIKSQVKKHLAASAKKKKLSELQATGALHNDQFDYVELADNTSSLSTPSTSLWDSPFAQDSLGDTVIHFDKALERMQEYKKTQKDEENAEERSYQGFQQRLKEVRQAAMSEQAGTNLDQGSESSEVTYPRIDTAQLDQQIKSIMTEVIPVIKEHMDDVCSPQLLAYIKRLVLSLTRQHDNGQEFTRFFHRQLGSILQDSMAKFEGRKMRECGEEILVEMSEVLFNELAFLRLMQDLHQPVNLADKLIGKTWFQSDQPLPNSKEMAALVGENSDGKESSVELTDEEGAETNLRMNFNEEEDLGKERDDELANEMTYQDTDKDDESYQSSGLKIELAPSETKPFTRIGSDEDDDEIDESQSMEDPSETAVSRDAKLEHTAAPQETVEADSKSQPAAPAQDTTQDDGFQEVNQVSSSPSCDADGTVTEVSSSTGGAQPGTETDNVTESETRPATDASHQMENHLPSQVNGEIEGEIGVDDLPASLNIDGPPGLAKKLDEEEKEVTGPEAILLEMNTGDEQAGDGNAIKDPDSFA